MGDDMSDDETIPSRPGSSADLSRRMDRMERRQDSTDVKVTDLAGVVARVEVNQNHAIELNQLRFTALDNGLRALASDVSQKLQGLTDELSGFMKRINGLVSGEQTTAQGQRMLAEYEKFKGDTEEFINAQSVLNGQVKLLGRLAVILVGSNVLGLLVAVVAFLTR